jgi:hypothetical protein
VFKIISFPLSWLTEITRGIFAALNRFEKPTLFAVLGALLFAQSTSGDVVSMGPEVDEHYGQVRGYWFTAPVDFKITGIHVLPLNGSAAGFMNWAVVRFDGGVPPPVPRRCFRAQPGRLRKSGSPLTSRRTLFRQRISMSLPAT